jgi:CubicO group peptidase (beta-lactamase class C family)
MRPSTMASDLASAVDGVLDVSKLSRFPTAVAVSVGDETVYWTTGEAVGPRAIGPDSVMYGASLAKQFTAALVAIAVIEGRIGYDMPVSAYLHGLHSWADVVRVRHLIHHASAIPSVAEGASDNDYALRRLHRSRELAATPGESFEYSNTGYVLLAEVLHSTLGKTVPELARDRIFAPLHMTNTHIGGTAPVRLSGYPPPRRTTGDGGLWTTASDLNTWLVALNRGLITPDPAKMVETPGALDNGQPLDYAWGCQVTPRLGRRTISHDGTWPGWRATTVRQPDQDIAVCILSSTNDDGLVSETGFALADLVD